MTTPNLNLDEWSGPQDQPWTTVNGAMHVIDALLPGTVVSNTLTTPPASPAAGACYIVAATATGAWAGWEDSIAAYIGGAWVQVVPKTGWLFYVQETGAFQKYDSGWAAFSASRTEGFGISFGGTPTANQIIGVLTYPYAITCPADLLGSVCTVGVNPTASFVIDVKDDGVTFGTITIATDGTATFASTGGVAASISAGSRISFHAPATVDATIADIAPTIVGTVL